LGYNSRSAASDIYELARHLGHQRVAIVAHDIGARVAYRLALDHEDTVERLALLDATPPTQLFGSQVPQVIQESWHVYFHQQFDLPEKLLEGREVLYLRHIFRDWSLNKFPLSDDEVAPYVQVYTHPSALRGGFGY
jgi:pimeloyl-ACP methyl ester carboxylesterase